MLTLVLGRAGSGKSYEIYKRIGEHIKRGEQAVLIVPEQNTLQAERELIESINVQGLISAQVLSPSRLMDYVFKETGGELISRLARQGHGHAVGAATAGGGT